ncbi:hypothetical protein R1sor_024217 [Riccia sorocarpa]|uniref:Endonuclease/exonuclease/phosphatase domain-containing protein n=1 Tax=Riccia sorocarpa TaxID=122646 RepID=A0ABD3GRF1_9MARC
MKLVICTYNVRGLCSRTARTKLRNVITDIKPALNILAIQEHKLWEGGLWIHIDLPDGLKIGLAAVYASHTPAERANLWERMEFTLDGSRRWLLAGDFNMITSTHDQIGGTPRPISGEENTKWTSFIRFLDAKDTFRPKDGALTWDNRRHLLLSQQQSTPTVTDGGRILKRLDRIYADPVFLQHSYSSTITAGSELSDHLPVISTFHLRPATRSKRSSYRMNTAALRDPILKNQLSSLWGKWQKTNEDLQTPRYKV